MLKAIYLQKLGEKWLLNLSQRLLAVSEAGDMMITFNLDSYYKIMIHELQNDRIISWQLIFEKELFLSQYEKYNNEEQCNAIVNTIKINRRNESTTILYMVTKDVNYIVKATLETPIQPYNQKPAEVQYFQIGDRIRDTALHPIENSLVVLTFGNLFILEANKTVELNLTGYGPYTTNHRVSDLVVIEENGEVDYYTFFNIKIDGRFGEEVDMKIRKVHEIAYAETYDSREELNVPVSFYSRFNKLGYDKYNKIFAVTTEEGLWEFHSVFFNTDLQLLSVEENYINPSSSLFMFFAKEENTMFMIKDFCRTCSKTPGCYNKFSVQNKTIIIEEPQKCYSEPFERGAYDFYGILGEVNINFDNNSQLFLYNQNYIFHTNVTDEDIIDNKNPHLYYQNSYFSEPNLKKNPFKYSFKNENHLILVQGGNIKKYEFRTKLVKIPEDDDQDNNDDEYNYIDPPQETSLEPKAIVGIALAGALFVMVIILIIYLCCERSKKSEDESQILGLAIIRINKKNQNASVDSEQSMKDQQEIVCQLCRTSNVNCYLPCRHYFHEACLKEQLKGREKVCPIYHENDEKQ